MFTVLIAEKEHIDAIQQDNKLFFEPFLKNKEISFCYWNPMGQNLADSVPGLLDAVGRKKVWRAVIINPVTSDSIKMRNPFDIVDYSAVSAMTPPKAQPDKDESWDLWENEWKKHYDEVATKKTEIYRSALTNPLQKLSTWLCFKPEDYILNDVKDKQSVQDWAMEQFDQNGLKPSARLELLEKSQYKNELRVKENIRREFLAGNTLNIAFPTEIQCISIRTTEKSYFDPEDYWNIYQDSEYSKFADRNMYFDKMRFMVFDLLPKHHRDYRTDYIRFLASTLIFISNPVPGSALQARRLYQLEVETDDAPLCTMVTSYDKKLSSTYEVIEAEMEKIRGEIPADLTDKAAEAMFCTPKDVPVLLDESCDFEKVFAEKDYGLFFDSPQNEYHKWNSSFRESEKALAYIAKQQSRAVRKSVNQMATFDDMLDINISRLTPLQIDDIRDYTDSEEDEMIASVPPDFTDVSKHNKRISSESEKIKKAISGRMSKKTVMILSAICIGLYIMCFSPFLLANHNTLKTVSTAVVLCLSMTGILAIILLATLFFLRTALIKAVKAYNDTVHEIINDIQSSLRRFSKYLSASSNVRRGHAVRKFATQNLDVYTRSLRIRKKHQEDIKKRRAQLLEDYGDYFGDRSTFCDETMCRPYEYDFDQALEFEYPAPFLAGDKRQIEFISGGNFVSVPSSYVTRISVRMEGIYEK